MNESRTPTLGGVIRGLIEEGLGDVNVAIPGRVEAFDPASARASVQPLVRRPYVTEDGTRGVERLPVIPDVPVIFPGSGPYSLRWPVAVGDTVLLVFASASLDQWLPRGGEVDPGDDRRHALSDAVAIPGLRDFAHPHSGGASKTIEFTPSEIRVGGSQALATKADIDALRSWAETHTHPAPGGATSAPAPPPSATGTTVLKGG